MAQSPEKIVIADDHPLFRNALKQIIGQHRDQAEIFEISDISNLQDFCQGNNNAQLLLLDLHIPGAKGFSGLIYMVNNHPQIPVLMISANDGDDIIAKAIRNGAAGFISKSADPEEISRAIDIIFEGDIYLPPGCNVDPEDLDDTDPSDIASLMAQLTPQQFKVATMLAEGLLNKQIAYELHVTEATIKAHVTEIFRKLGVSSRTQAVLAISQLDIAQPNLV